VRCLRRVKRLIQRGWTRGASARDKCGRECSALSRRAVRFCIFGAAVRASRNATEKAGEWNSWQFIREAAFQMYGDTPVVINDSSRSSRRVLAVIDHAVELARRRSDTPIDAACIEIVSTVRR
jgi:hypothetical protein